MNSKEKFCFSEEDLDWIGLKKSEYLSVLISNVSDDDYQFEEYHRYNDRVSETVGSADYAYEKIEDSKRIRTYVKSYQDKERVGQVVIGAVLNEIDKSDEVFVPIIVFLTKKDNLLKFFEVGKTISQPTLN